MYIQPLRAADPPIIPRDRLSAFITDVFHNFDVLQLQHRRLLDRLHAIQRDEHPAIHSITAAIFDAAINWREAYMEYITNYPIADYRIDDEMANNSAFKDFVEVRSRPIPSCVRIESTFSFMFTAMYASCGRKPPRYEELCEPTNPTSRTVRVAAKGHNGSQP
jgi:RhoGEF domain